MSLRSIAKTSALSLCHQFSPLRRLAVKYCTEYLQIPNLLTGTPSHILREVLLLPPGETAAQLNQDIFALVVNRFRPGYFLEIGANDGRTLSNTLYLESEFGWRGGLIEANPRYEDALRRRRASVLIKGIGDEERTARFVDAGLYGGLAGRMDTSHEKHTQTAECIEVQLTTLKKALVELNVPKRIDFLSIDVEGTECSIVKQLVQSGHRVRSGCVEVNARQSDRDEIKRLLAAHGYQVVWDGQTCQDLFFVSSEAISESFVV